MAALAQGLPGAGWWRTTRGQNFVFSNVRAAGKGGGGVLHWVTRTLLMQCFFLVLQLRKGRKRTSGQARMPRHPGFTRRPGPHPPSTGSRCYPPVPSASSLALSIMPCFFPFTCPHHPKCLKWGGTRDSGQLEHRPPAKVFDSPVPTFLFPLLDAITKK